MTRIDFHLRGGIAETATPKDWTEALDIIGRAFYPDGLRLGGPEIPKEAKR